MVFIDLVPLFPLPQLFSYAKDIQAPYHLLKETARLGRLPVVNFAAGGVATPADAALMMQLGMDGVFVGSGKFFDNLLLVHLFLACLSSHNNSFLLHFS